MDPLREGGHDGALNGVLGVVDAKDEVGSTLTWAWRKLPIKKEKKKM